jgi:O-antigen/teichoic acid export membrane protein
MGNTYSSSGTIAGSILGVILVAPFIERPSLVAIAIASCIGIIIGTTTYIYNIKKKNVLQKKEQKRNLIVGTAYGAILLACGYTCTLDEYKFYISMMILNNIMDWAVRMLVIENLSIKHKMD